MKIKIHDKTRRKVKRALTPAEKVLLVDLVQDGLRIQKKFRPEPLYKQTGKGHYESKTVEEIRRAKKLSQRRKKP